MRKTIILALVLGLLVGATSGPALGKKKKKKAKPVETVLYMHGENQFGELDGVQWFEEGGGGTSPMTLTPEEPGSGPPKSMTIFNPALNDQCSGLPLAFPTFFGDFNGTIKGDVTMYAHFASGPGTISARLWTDTPVFSCNDAYIEPASEVDVELPPGQGEVEVVFPDLNLKGTNSIMIEILAYSGTDYRGQVGRLLYDTADFPGRLEFKCVPASGKSCTP